MTMIVSDLVADLLADGCGQKSQKSQASRKAETLAALSESQGSQESQGVAGKRESGDPWTDLYRAWLSGISEPRVLLTLDDAQARQAVAVGVVSRATARASVLLLVRAPKGETGPGAVGVLAIPRERYRDFSPMAAVEALSRGDH